MLIGRYQRPVTVHVGREELEELRHLAASEHLTVPELFKKATHEYRSRAPGGGVSQTRQP